MGSMDEGASWFPIRNVAQDGKKWKVNPPVDEIQEDWILYVVDGKPLDYLEWDSTKYKLEGE